MSIIPLGKEDYSAARVGAILPANITEAITIAKTLLASGLFPDLKNAEQGVAKIMAGSELGIPPIQSLNAFHIVQGKIMMHYSAIGYSIRRAGYDYREIELTDVRCEIQFLDRKGKDCGRSVFTKADADRQKTQNMQSKPQTMLFARALSQGARRFVPEAFNGAAVYSFEDQFSPEFEEEFPAEALAQTPGSSARLEAKVTDIDVDPEFDPFPTATPPDVDPNALVFEEEPVE